MDKRKTARSALRKKKLNLDIRGNRSQANSTTPRNKGIGIPEKRK